MVAAGVIVTVLGFVLAVLSVVISDSLPVRSVIVLVGIALSLYGIIGLINRAYLQDAIWKK